ncbi:hypothetical protein [Rhodocyclus tenuis]|uniref:Uncharacterized protein n=1 Tax=Rhodocyclus tenuis TaxID=1066 RepID=A0A840G8J2_RHOTE|nr:hypothetical protein [Rhodocyclus tenuis]MBB4248653.1 hypothetical protein [Rhodocyclus tenuis]
MPNASPCANSFSALPATRHATHAASVAIAGDRCVALLSLLVLLAQAIEGLLH